jgi:hypothetical protein
LKLQTNEPLSKFAFSFNLRRYIAAKQAKDKVTILLDQTKGGIEGTPPGLVNWINQRFRTQRGVTEVTLDAAAGTVTAEVDMEIVLAMPSWRGLPLFHI